MRKNVNILTLFKMLLMACLVVFMLTACNGNEQDNVAQSPMADGSGEVASDDEIEKTAASHSECWQTEIVDLLYNLMGKVALTTYRKMLGGSFSLVMVGFAIWLALRLMKHLSSMKEETIGEVWTEIFKMAFLCWICGLIASRASLVTWFLGDLIFPIYNAFLEFAAELLKAVGKAQPVSGSVVVFGHSVPFTGFGATPQTTCAAATTVTWTTDATGFPDSPKQMMDCMICAMSNSLSFGMVLALTTMKGAGFTGWLVGLFVLICFLFVKLAFVFYLIDTIFRFTVMVVMLPLMIMGYPFPKTRGLLSQGVKNMVNSAGFMMFFAIIISMCIKALETILKSFQQTFSSPDSFKDFSVPLVCMMMIAFLVISSVSIAGKLCDKFIGGSSNAQFQKSAKALIVGAAKWIISLGTKIVTVAMPKKAQNFVGDKMEKYLNIKNKAAGALGKMTGKS